MATLELNIRAKDSYELVQKRKRRNEMRQWRKSEYLVFSGKADFDKWLAYTKWYKRPVELKINSWSCTVKFLDYKAKK